MTHITYDRIDADAVAFYEVKRTGAWYEIRASRDGRFVVRPMGKLPPSAGKPTRLVAVVKGK